MKNKNKLDLCLNMNLGMVPGVVSTFSKWPGRATTYFNNNNNFIYTLLFEVKLRSVVCTIIKITNSNKSRDKNIHTFIHCLYYSKTDLFYNKKFNGMETSRN